MSRCEIDHSVDSVIKKLNNQREFMPNELVDAINHYLEENHPQNDLNDLFHLLKKYDLAPNEERDERNKKLTELIHG